MLIYLMGILRQSHNLPLKVNLPVVVSVLVFYHRKIDLDLSILNNSLPF